VTIVLAAAVLVLLLVVLIRFVLGRYNEIWSIWEVRARIDSKRPPNPVSFKAYSLSIVKL
jgi:hypothetical protein